MIKIKDKSYRVFLSVWALHRIVVEANSVEEAEAKARACWGEQGEAAFKFEDGGIDSACVEEVQS